MTAAAALTGCLTNRGFHGGKKRSRPNILLLYADDLGIGDLVTYNPDSKIPTPHLDRLASKGVRFTDAHASCTVCTPSRYALLTGRYHWRDLDTDMVDSFGKSIIRKDRLTLPEMLKAAGYRTGAIGKWHLGWDWDALRKSDENGNRLKGNHFDVFDWDKSIPDGPLAHGFDYYFGDDVINFPPYCWIENDKVVNVPDMMMDWKKWKPVKEGSWECRSGTMASDWNPYQDLPTLTQKGINFIK